MKVSPPHSFLSMFFKTSCFIFVSLSQVNFLFTFPFSQPLYISPTTSPFQLYPVYNIIYTDPYALKIWKLDDYLASQTKYLLIKWNALQMKYKTKQKYQIISQTFTCYESGNFYKYNFCRSYMLPRPFHVRCGQMKKFPVKFLKLL